MITNDMIRSARQATSEVNDNLLVALVTFGGGREGAISGAIANLHDAAEALGYTIAHKDDGK